jgi:hypothetical protein
MDISGIIPIVIAILLFAFIFYRLIRKNIKSTPISVQGTYTDSNVIAIKNANSIAQHITNAPSNFFSKPIKSLYVKGAYGGGFNGSDVCTDMMLYTISLGYRYVVINVFLDVPYGSPPTATKTAIVGFSTLYSPMNNVAGRTVPLTDFVQFLQQNAFSPTAPNPTDPFFLHILPAYQSSTSSTDDHSSFGFNTQLNSQIEQSLSLLQGSNRSSGQVLPETSLGQIMGKFVVVMDAFSLDGNMTPNLQNMIGMNITTSSLQKAKPIIPSSSSSSSITWKEILPFDENGSLLTSVPDYSNIYKSNNMNVSPVCVWVSRFIMSSMVGKSTLGDYEQLFADSGGSAFITL